MLRDVFKINTRKACLCAFVLFFSFRSWYLILGLNKFMITQVASFLLIYAFVLIAVFLSRIIQKRLLIFIGIIGLCAGIFLITYLMHPNYGYWILRNADYNVFRSVFYPTTGLFAFLFVLMCDDPEDLRKGMKIVAYLMLIYGVYQLIPVIQRGGVWNNVSRTGLQVNQSTHSLGFGYRTVMCAVVFFEEFLQTKKKWYLVLSLGSLTTVLIFGGRGCVLVFILYLILRYITHMKKITKRDILLLGLAILALVLNEFGAIKSIIISVFDFFGLSNVRTVDMLLNGTLFEDDARVNIWTMAIEMIKTGGLFGRGAYGDRIVIGNYYSWGYSHNIFLELIVSFGVIGFIIACMLVWKVIKYLKAETDDRWKNLFIVFLCLSFQLLVSDSFWYNSWFWGVLALLCQQKLRSKKKRVEEK